MTCSASPVLNQRRHQGAPACLVRRTQTGPVIPVIELVKKNQILPVGVFLELRCTAVNRPFTKFISSEDPSHAVGDLTRNLHEILWMLGIVGQRNPKVIAITGA